MGYEVPRRTALLKFEDGVHDGLEVMCAFDVPLDTFIWFSRQMNADDIDSTEGALKRWGDEILESWNVEDKGVAVPANAEGVMSLGLAFARDIVVAWTESMSAADPLAGTSTSSSTASVNGGVRDRRKSSKKTPA